METTTETRRVDECAGRGRPVHERARRRAAGHEGMTLIEIMVVVIIMALIASGVSIGVFSALKRARVKETQQAVDTIGSAVRLYQNDHAGVCPTIDQLRQDGQLDSSKSANDPWGHPFQISCEGEDVTVLSGGPDGHVGGDDDISNHQGAAAQGTTANQ